jgi:RNA polymerase sigma-70 factor (ECF subfamily)
MTIAEEITAVRKLASGDADAFHALFEAHHEAVFRFVYRLTNSVHVAEDVTQDCFLRFASKPGGFDPGRGSLRGFLCGMARNLVRQWWRVTGREVELDDDYDAEPDAKVGCERSDALSPDIAEAVQTAVGQLPVLQREAVVLFEFESLSLEEVAQAVNADVGTVKSRLFRARRRLRGLLEPFFDKIKPEA